MLSLLGPSYLLAVCRELWGGSEQLRVVGNAVGDRGLNTVEHARMALACFKNLLPQLQTWGVEPDPAYDVYDEQRPILLSLGDLAVGKCGTSVSWAFVTPGT